MGESWLFEVRTIRSIVVLPIANFSGEREKITLTANTEKEFKNKKGRVPSLESVHSQYYCDHYTKKNQKQFLYTHSSIDLSFSLQRTRL